MTIYTLNNELVASRILTIEIQDILIKNRLTTEALIRAELNYLLNQPNVTEALSKNRQHSSNLLKLSVKFGLYNLFTYLYVIRNIKTPEKLADRLLERYFDLTNFSTRIPQDTPETAGLNRICAFFSACRGFSTLECYRNRTRGWRYNADICPIAELANTYRMKNILDVIQIEQDDPLGSLITQVKTQQDEILELKQKLESIQKQNQDKDELIAALCQNNGSPLTSISMEMENDTIPKSCNLGKFLRQYRKQALSTGIQGRELSLEQRPETAKDYRTRSKLR